MPYMMQVAVGRLEKLTVFGTDYDTPDGSGVRDYIHVMDVADAHRVAMDHLDDHHGLRTLNIGTGTGVSVLELLATFQEVCGVTVPHEIAGRQPGTRPAPSPTPAGWTRSGAGGPPGTCGPCARTPGVSRAFIRTATHA